MKRYLIFFSFCFSLSAYAQFQFNGMVQDAHTHLGIEQVQVLLKPIGKNTSMLELTAVDGSFTFVLFEEGQYEVTLSHIGYVNQSMKMQITAQNTKGHVEIMVLEPF